MGWFPPYFEIILLNRHRRNPEMNTAMCSLWHCLGVEEGLSKKQYRSGLDLDWGKRGGGIVFFVSNTRR